MRRVTKLLVAMALGLAALAAPASSSASPRPKVEWARVDVPDGDGAARRVKVLKEALKQASKRASFGKAPGTVVMSARVMEFSSEVHGDVLRVTCTVMGRVAGGAGARSRISYGGSPDRREDLEKEVLTMVANGLVARLAQIVRARTHEPIRTAPLAHRRAAATR